ncbi:MAG: trypsin-like serine protease [Proteobacteria bacterium]|nr:trypsin-like serine protease [Pseudomonadota bacterium]
MPTSTYRQGRLVMAATALAILGLAGASRAAEPMLSVSNTGVVQQVPESSARGSAPFRPDVRAVEVAGLQTEVAPFTMTDAEYARFMRDFKPAVPYYAKDAPAPETVLGADRRFRYSPKESYFPYQSVGQLTFTQNGGSYTCTGWLIGNNTVMTAGHCVHSGGSWGAWSSNVMFYPARNGKNNPFGGCSARTLYSQTGWTVLGSETSDYGAVKLNCTVGNSTGWFGWYWTTASQAGVPILVLGYPGDKQRGTAWGAAARIEYSETYKTRYKADTAGGMSGGPVVQADGSGICQGDCGIAVHAYGQDTLGTNSATRITQTVSNFMLSWRDAP